MFCIGELLEERKANITNKVLERQLTLGLAGLSPENLENVVIAYEPVWAIGASGTPASAEYAQEKHEFIKNTLVELFGEQGEEITVLYGGSVNPQNAKELIQKPNIDGLFIGRSAWDAKAFNDLIREVLNIVKEATC